MRVLVTPGEEVEDLRTSGSVHYIFIGFGSSVIFPEAAEVSTLRAQRLMCGPVVGMGLEPGLSDPFKDDVLCMTALSQTMVRVIEGVCPEIGPFFDTILQCNYDEVPSAAQALKTFRELRSNLTARRLGQPSGGEFRKNGGYCYLATKEVLCWFLRHFCTEVGSENEVGTTITRSPPASACDSQSRCCMIVTLLVGCVGYTTHRS